MSSDRSTDALITRLEARVAGYGRPRALVAVSGGVDSSVVLAVAARGLGATAVTAVTAVSPSYPEGELDQARMVARSVGADLRVILTNEVDREAYARNDGQRCFHCKTELFATLRRLADTAGGDQVVLAGANADDLADVRPGLRAAGPHGVRNPLLEEGVRKQDVRAAARRLGLAVADKPALACLSSRVAFGVRITPDLLRRIDLAEQAVRALGFPVVRVRHLGRSASIEVSPERVAALVGHRAMDAVRDRLRSLGWDDVSVDPLGYRPGSMNATLAQPSGGTP